ncbi:UPF0481 protein At3g47200-like [Andrographis paniculata]|uniref:UPF0481 protein At3g47200-like n=1 Tax=Andrographis paniculata TaxID=175694 RepID=UPI0021E84B3C|nr:UPF0481 protein At3g47200-like [Andrographis paniculata]
MSSQVPSWVVEISERVKKVNVERPSIDTPSKALFRVSQNFPDEYGDKFKPYKVSIGPYHCNSPSCEKEEKFKEYCILYGLKKTGKPPKDFYNALYEIKDDLRNSYDKLEPVWDDDSEFLRLMFRDGFYLLVMLESSQLFVGESYMNVGKTKPLFDPNEMENYRHDLLLLENQIPLMVLLKLLSVAVGKSDHGYVHTTLIIQILNFCFQTETYVKGHEYLHILDVYRHAFLYPSDPREPLSIYSAPPDLNIPSATQLQEARIAIKISTTRCVSSISFQDSILSLPFLNLDNVDRSVYFNVLLFERFHEQPEMKDFASYVYFMSNILKGAKDVSHLRSCGVIRTSLSDDEVAEMFYWLCKSVPFNPGDKFNAKLWDVGSRMKDEHDKKSEAWRKDLYQNYLRSPWAIVSLVAAFLLFVLSVIQTIYAVLSYVHRKDK